MWKGCSFFVGPTCCCELADHLSVGGQVAGNVDVKGVTRSALCVTEGLPFSLSDVLPHIL